MSSYAIKSGEALGALSKTVEVVVKGNREYIGRCIRYMAKL